MIIITRNGYDIACDGHGCKSVIGEPCETKQQAIEMKQKYGWATIDKDGEKQDYCPKCDLYKEEQ